MNSQYFSIYEDHKDLKEYRVLNIGQLFYLEDYISNLPHWIASESTFDKWTPVKLDELN